MKSNLISIVLLLLLIGSVYVTAEEGLFCGISKMDITPTEPVIMAGYENRTDLSKGIHDSLSVRVVAFQSGKDKLVLVSTDVIGFYSGTAEIIRQSILKKYKLDPSELFLTAIHTHAAPSITLDLENGHPNNVAYTKILQKRILQTVGEALKNVKPAEIGTGTGYSPVGVNRREVFYDEVGNPRTWIGRNPSGVQDKEVQVLKILQEKKLAGVLFDYACHSTSLGWDNYQISGDIHGLAEQFIERYFGGGVVAPGFAGASGDIDPWYRVLPGFDTKNGWVPEPVLMGTMLGEEVIHVLRAIESMDCGGEIRSDHISLELPGKPRGEWETTIDHPKTTIDVTVARVGEVAFVGLGGEILSEIGLAIKVASPFQQTFIFTHCNGTSGYMAPQHRFIEQGYEIQSTPFASTAANMLVKQVVKMLHAL
ncbi:neutral/alkaline non-lysosomal ceramidase N-terminal domain-containing protein [candidate division KSB1 bacterium]|nr:neutral/alkaline non-lysosomal ceramidase N-terminal domain-containing protein [candidate division KSB1 bacterium]